MPLRRKKVTPRKKAGAVPMLAEAAMTEIVLETGVLQAYRAAEFLRITGGVPWVVTNENRETEPVQAATVQMFNEDEPNYEAFIRGLLKQAYGPGGEPNVVVITPISPQHVGIDVIGPNGRINSITDNE